MKKFDGVENTLTCPECGRRDPPMKPRGDWFVCDSRKPGSEPFYRCGQPLLPLPPLGISEHAESMARYIFTQCGIKECPCASERCPVGEYRRSLE